MNQTRFVSSLMLCAIALPLAAPLSATAQDRFADSYADAIESLLKDRFGDGNSCMVIGLVDEHGSRVFSVGELDNGTESTVDGNTIFEIGSVTKVFTSLLLLDAVRRGEMKLDDPLAKHLPAGVIVPEHEGRQITLFNLAAQDSGLPRFPDNLVDRDLKDLSRAELRESCNAYTTKDLYEFLSTYELTGDPGTSFRYSNVGMALLGHAIERRAGADYESLVVDRICRPLKMESTRIELNREQKTRLARGHWADGRPAKNVDFQVFASAGSLLSTANDLLRFLSANLEFCESDLTPLIRETQRIRHTDSPRFGRTAMPWYDERVYNPPGLQIVAHGGGGFGYLAFVGVEQSQRRGVVVLTNQLAFNPDGIGWTLLQGMPLTHENITYRVREIVGLGIGLEMDEKTRTPRIKTVWPESPAGKAGVRSGLSINRINGVAVEGKTFRECLNLMAGPIGTKVRLEFLNPNREETSTVDLVKQKFLTATGQSE